MGRIESGLTGEERQSTEFEHFSRFSILNSEEDETILPCVKAFLSNPNPLIDKI